MRRGILISAFFVAIIVAAGFSNDPSNENETRNLSGFTKINFGISGDLYITLGNEFKVVLEGDKSYLDDIITEISGDKLVIKKENWRQNFNERVTVYITMPAITGLGVSGSGRAEIKDPVKSDNLDLSVSGSGKLYVTDMKVSELECRISGSGDIILTGNGNAGTAEISVSGSGNYTGDQVKIAKGEISISGSGSCSCYVTESLKASVSGSGNVSYQGNPKIDARVSGSGRVRSK